MAFQPLSKRLVGGEGWVNQGAHLQKGGSSLRKTFEEVHKVQKSHVSLSLE